MAKYSISLDKIKLAFANTNAIALLVGYALFTTIIFSFVGNASESVIRGFSMLYRAFALIIGIFTILLNVNTPLLISKKTAPYFLLLFLFAIRIVYDLFIRPSEISSSDTKYIFLFVFGGVYIPTIALYLSYRDLNLKLIYYTVFYILIFIIAKGIIYSLGLNLTSWGRGQMNVAQSTLTFGSFAALLCLLSFSKIITYSINYRQKWFYIITFCLGLWAVAIAGSRGPLFGLVITILIYFFSKNLMKSLKTSLIIFLILLIFGPFMIQLIKEYSPAIYSRTYDTIVNYSLGGREPIFRAAFDQILSHPLLGDWILLDRTDKTSFAHNAFLQTTMTLGIFGGFLIVFLYTMLFRNSIKIIHTNSLYSFWGLSTLYYMIYSLTTGGIIYLKGDFNFSFLILLVICSRYTNLYCQVFRNEFDENT
jgi:O-antigen ligase